MELYVSPERDTIMDISHSFGIDAQIVGHVESYSGRKLTIHTEAGIFEY